MPKDSKEEGIADRLAKHVKKYDIKGHSKKIKEHGSKIADGVVKHTSLLGKGVAEGSAVLGDGVMKGSKALGKGVVEGSKIVGSGVKEGTALIGKGTVAAAEGVKHFLEYTAEKLHLKKPDMHALDELEEEISPSLPTEIAKRWYMKNVKLKPKKGKGKLVLKWNRVFCWHENPFKVEILRPVDNFFVCDKKKKSLLNMFLVKQHKFGKITGDEGTGKTTFLHWIHWELEEHHPEVVPCFIDATRKTVGGKSVSKQLMDPFLNIYQKTVSRPFEGIHADELGKYIAKKVGGKPFVLLVDEPHNVSETALPFFAALNNAGVKVQVIIAGRKENLRGSTLWKNEKDSLKFDLHGLDTHLASLFLRKRIESFGGEGTYPFDSHKIAILVKQTGGNPVALLEKAKEKAIQLSIDHREELIQEQREIIKQREEEVRQKHEAEKEKRRQEKEERRHTIEAEREKRMEIEEKKREDIERKHQEVLDKEDDQLDKIDDMIGSILGGITGKKKQESDEGVEKKEEKKDDDELKKHDALVQDAVGKIPEEKGANQILEEDPDLVADLQHVLAETDAAAKKQKDMKSHKNSKPHKKENPKKKKK